MHVLLRIPKLGTEIDALCHAHDEVSLSCGSVWIAIAGRAFSSRRERDLDEQIRRQMKTYLYVAQMAKQGTGFQAFRAEVSQVSSSFLDVEATLVPKYYEKQRILPNAKSWLRIGGFKEVKSDAFNSLRVAGNGKPVSAVLQRSMLSVVFVCAD
ncbi:MAG TPA: hypothetical protein VMU26_07315 [Candidatus Polarisedimenticolia bacterium]|nr:hypothetical protein [Candidatus Polarisedimenticolia bacterium]